MLIHLSSIGPNLDLSNIFNFYEYIEYIESINKKIVYSFKKKFNMRSYFVMFFFSKELIILSELSLISP